MTYAPAATGSTFGHLPADCYVRGLFVQNIPVDLARRIAAEQADVREIVGLLRGSAGQFWGGADGQWTVATAMDHVEEPAANLLAANLADASMDDDVTAGYGITLVLVGRPRGDFAHDDMGGSYYGLRPEGVGLDLVEVYLDAGHGWKVLPARGLEVTSMQHGEAPGPQHVARLKQIVDEVREHEGLPGQCGFVAEIVANEFGWPSYTGFYHSRDGRVIGDHTWNVHEPSGTIIDATADQHREGNTIRFVHPDDPEYARYQYGADEADDQRRYDEAARNRREHGEHWWTKGSLHVGGPASDTVPLGRFPVEAPERDDFGPNDVVVFKPAAKDIAALPVASRRLVEAAIERLRNGTARSIMEPKEREPLLGTYTLRVTNSLRVGFYLSGENDDWCVYWVGEHNYVEAERRFWDSPGYVRFAAPQHQTFRRAAAAGVVIEEATPQTITRDWIRDGERGVVALVDGTEVGHLIWRIGTGEVARVLVEREYRRQGIATLMLQRARAIDPSVHHSTNLTDDGREWSQKVGGANGDLPEGLTFDVQQFEEHGNPEVYIVASAPERAAVGTLRVRSGQIVSINVDYRYRRRGIASALLAEARKYGDVEHSEDLTPDGRAWSEKVGGLNGDLPSDLQIGYNGYYVEAYIDGDTVGQLGWYRNGDKAGVISNIDVRPSWQRRGIASAMLAWAREHFPEANIRHAEGKWLSDDGKAWSEKVAAAVDGVTFEVLADKRAVRAFFHDPTKAFGRGFVGSLLWDEDGRIDWVEVNPDYQRRGVASEMLRLAREADPRVHHAGEDNLTDDGKAWSEKVAGANGDLPPQLAWQVLLDLNWNIARAYLYLGGPEIGRLTWDPKSGEVVEVKVDPEYRRRGVAAFLWDKAKEADSHIHHSDVQTPEGKAWAERVGALKPLPAGLFWRCQERGTPFGPEHATSRPWGTEPGHELERKGYSCMVGPWELWGYWAERPDWVLDDDVIAFSGEKTGSIGFEGLAVPDMRTVQRMPWAEFERRLLDTPVPTRVDINTSANTWADLAVRMLLQNPDSVAAQMLLGQRTAAAYGPDLIARGIKLFDYPEAFADKVAAGTVTAADFVKALTDTHNHGVGVWWGVMGQYGDLEDFETYAWGEESESLKTLREEGHVGGDDFIPGEIQTVLIAKRPTRNGEPWDPEIHNPFNALMGNSYLEDGEPIDLVEIRYDAGWGWKSLQARGLRAHAGLNLTFERAGANPSDPTANDMLINARVGGLLVGYVRFHEVWEDDDYTPYIDMLEVNPDYARQGVARALFERLKQEYYGVQPKATGAEFTPAGAAMWKALTGETVRPNSRSTQPRRRNWHMGAIKPLPEGYVMEVHEQEKYGYPALTILVKHEGRPIAALGVHQSPDPRPRTTTNVAYVSAVQVYPEHQRKGIATAMYAEVHKRWPGIPVWHSPGQAQSADARALNQTLKAEFGPTMHIGSLTTEDFFGREGERSHITRNQKGTVPTEAIAHLLGARGETPGAHRNRQGPRWQEFLDDIRANGITDPIFITVDPGEEPRISEGNHRRDAAVELGLPEVPVEIRYFGHAERHTTIASRDGAAWSKKVAGANGDLPAGLTFTDGPITTAEGAQGHQVKAFVDGLPAGYLRWVTEDAANYRYGEIYDVMVIADMRRRGIASAMLKRARQIDPEVRHSSVVTDDGAEFAIATGAKTAAGGWYHVAPRRVRESIREHGLDPAKGSSPWKIYDWIRYPQGTYLFSDPYDALRYITGFRSSATGFERDWDVWKVDTDGLDLTPDPLAAQDKGPFTGDLAYAVEPVPAERLTLMGKSATAGHTFTTRADLEDFAAEFLAAAPGKDLAGQCFTLAWNVAHEFGLPLVEGDYDGHPHAWNLLPDGSIFDGTSAQFGEHLDSDLYHARTQRTAARDFKDPEASMEAPQWGWQVKRGAQALWGVGNWRAMFGDAPQTTTPWPMYRSKPGDRDRRLAALAEVLRNPGPYMRDVDPRVLMSTQGSITRQGVAYYLYGDYDRTGETFADQGDLGNQVPVVWHLADGRWVILAGHHRAAAALLKGVPLRAAVVEETASDSRRAHALRDADPVPGHAQALWGPAGDVGRPGGGDHRDGWHRRTAAERLRGGGQHAAGAGRQPLGAPLADALRQDRVAAAASGLTLYRGQATPIAGDLQRTPEQWRDAALAAFSGRHEGLGQHWSRTVEVAQKFAQQTPGSILVSPRGAWVPVVIEAEVDPMAVDNDAQYDAGGLFAGEAEEYVTPGAAVRVTAVHLRLPGEQQGTSPAGDEVYSAGQWVRLPVTLQATAAPLAPVPDGLTFKRVTGEYDDESDGLAAYLGGERVGEIHWQTVDIPGDHTWEGVKVGEIGWVHVEPAYRRRGIARMLWDAAKQIEPRLHHSNVQTADGQQWGRMVAKIANVGPYLNEWRQQDALGKDHPLNVQRTPAQLRALVQKVFAAEWSMGGAPEVKVNMTRGVGWSDAEMVDGVAVLNLDSTPGYKTMRNYWTVLHECAHIIAEASRGMDAFDVNHGPGFRAVFQELLNANGGSAVHLAKSAAREGADGHFDMSGDEPVWVQPHESLVRDALWAWKGWPGDMERCIEEEIVGAPQPGSGSGKIMRAQGAALLKELTERGKSNPRALYRGGRSRLERVTEWTTRKVVAKRFGQGNDAIRVLKTGQAPKCLRVADYISSGLDSDEAGWLVLDAPETGVLPLKDAAAAVEPRLEYDAVDGEPVILTAVEGEPDEALANLRAAHPDAVIVPGTPEVASSPWWGRAQHTAGAKGATPDLTLRDRPAKGGSEDWNKGKWVVEAFVDGDPTPVGSLTWQRTFNPDTPWMEQGHIVGIGVRPFWQRRGIATAMLAHARTLDPTIHHADPGAMSPDGAAWAQTIAGKNGDLPDVDEGKAWSQKAASQGSLEYTGVVIETFRTVRKDSNDRVSGERVRGRVHRIHEVADITWCGRKMPGLAVRRSGQTMEDVDCPDCQQAVRRGTPTPYKRR